jgi:hypothetical protein
MFKRDLDLERNWHVLLETIKKNIGVKPKDLNGVLFLIGVQELGGGSRIFSKEEKQDLLHIAICKVLSLAGYYTLDGLGQRGLASLEVDQKITTF